MNSHIQNAQEILNAQRNSVLNAGFLNVDVTQQNAGSSKKTTKSKKNPIKTSKTHKCKDGIVRKLYQKGTDFYVKIKSKITGKFFYKKV